MINANSRSGVTIKSMPKCGTFGAASTAGWGAGAAAVAAHVACFLAHVLPPHPPPAHAHKPSLCPSPSAPFSPCMFLGGP